MPLRRQSSAYTQRIWQLGGLLPSLPARSTSAQCMHRSLSQRRIRPRRSRLEAQRKVRPRRSRTFFRNACLLATVALCSVGVYRHRCCNGLPALGRILVLVKN